jgi:vacuolar protein sorting-associated protein 26
LALDGVDKRKHVEVKMENDKRQRLPLYLDGETVSGKVIK